MSSRGDVVFTFSQLTWHAARARGMFFPEDRLAAALLHDASIERVLVVNQMRSRPIVWARRLRGDEDDGFPCGPGRALAQPTRLGRGEPVDPATARRVYARYDAQVRAAARKLGMERPAVITANPLAAAFCEFAWAGDVTYYAVDDWLVHPQYAHLEQVHQAAYEAIRARGRRVCAVSDPLLCAVAPEGRGCVVPNGIEPDEWTAPAPGAASPGGPHLVYVGSLDTRIDTDAVARVAHAVPDARISLVGPLVDAGHYADLAGIANVALEPPVDRAAVARLLRGADACLLPHRHTPLTECMSPLKVYEYLAAGRPVVATDLPPVRGIDERVVLVPPGGDFPAGVREALALGPASETERAAFIAANAWSQRFDDILGFAFAA